MSILVTNILTWYFSILQNNRHGKSTYYLVLLQSFCSWPLNLGARDIDPPALKNPCVTLNKYLEFGDTPPASQPYRPRAAVSSAGLQRWEQSLQGKDSRRLTDGGAAGPRVSSPPHACVGDSGLTQPPQGSWQALCNLLAPGNCKLLTPCLLPLRPIHTLMVHARPLHNGLSFFKSVLRSSF